MVRQARRIKRQFVSACTHRATTCLFAYVCVLICMQPNQNQKSCERVKGTVHKAKCV